jgi:hypothetical protein
VSCLTSSCYRPTGWSQGHVHSRHSNPWRGIIALSAVWERAHLECIEASRRFGMRALCAGDGRCSFLYEARNMATIATADQATLHFAIEGIALRRRWKGSRSYPVTDKMYSDY